MSLNELKLALHKLKIGLYKCSYIHEVEEIVVTCNIIHHKTIKIIFPQNFKTN